MRASIILIFFMFPFTQGMSLEEKLTWETVDNGEIIAEKWIQSLEKGELLLLGDMTQQPDELILIRAYYPHLLPEDFFNYHTEMTCYPAFLALKESKNLSAFQAWEQCIGELWRDEPPAPISRALKDLRPQ